MRIEEVCPFCGIVNLVYLGNMDDQTARDVESFKCYKCGNFAWLGNYDDTFFRDADTPESYFAEGEKMESRE
jgi:hypothetical protein